MPQALNLVVDRRVLFDIGVGMGDVGLRLVIIVIRNEVFDGVFREEFPEFAAKLSGKYLVMCQYQCRAV